MTVSSRDRARGCLLALACGDALGAPAEFYSAAAGQKMLGVDGPLRDMVSGGMLQWQAGETTDDTAMMMLLADSLRDAGTYDQTLTLQRYVDWYETNPKGIGSTVDGVLSRVAAGMSAAAATQAYHDEREGLSAGNGSLMRVAPLALRYRNWPTDLREHTRRDSHLIHFDPLAADACELFTRLLSCALNDEDEATEITPAPALWDAYESTLDDAARRAASPDQAGYVLTALAVACAAHHNDLTVEEGIIWAVSLGGDTDTNAAVTGALLGARDGAEALPQRWTDKVHNSENILAVADRLHDQGT